MTIYSTFFFWNSWVLEYAIATSRGFPAELGKHPYVLRALSESPEKLRLLDNVLVAIPSFHVFSFFFIYIYKCKYYILGLVFSYLIIYTCICIFTIIKIFLSLQRFTRICLFCLWSHLKSICFWPVCCIDGGTREKVDWWLLK